MERLDFYEIPPKGMNAYLASHGHHFSKPMLEWAVSMMRDREGRRIELIEKKQLDDALKTAGVVLKRTEGYYDPVYVWCMAKADYYGSSITDDLKLAVYVRDYIDDPDGNPTRAFDEFYVNCLAKGIDIPWIDLL